MTPTQPQAKNEAGKAPADRLALTRKAGLVSRWIDDHRQTLKGPLGWYGIRNAANCAVAIAGLVAVIVPTKRGMGKLALYTKENGLFGSNKLGKGLHDILAEPVVQGMVGVGASFATFRTMFKIGKRNYDRVVTNAHSAGETADALHHIPVNIANDVKDIIPAELPATALAAVPLVAIRAALGGIKTSGMRDVLACIPAYTVFFETTERLYDDLQTKRGKPNNEHSHKGGKEASPTCRAMKEDGVVPILFRQAPAVALGITAYILSNRHLYKQPKFGEGLTGQVVYYNKAVGAQKDSFLTGFKREIGPFEMFPLYTVLSEAWRETYDKLADRIEKKYDERHPVTAGR